MSGDHPLADQPTCGSRSPHAHAGVPGRTWLLAVTDALQTSGSRLTSPRRAVLHWIAASETPFTAETLTQELAPELATGSRATIYRLLSWLRTEGWLARTHRSDRVHALIRQLPGHHQAICLGCGSTLLIGGCDLAPVVSPSLAGTGFTVAGHLLEVYGWCAPCSTTGRPHAVASA